MLQALRAHYFEEHKFNRNMTVSPASCHYTIEADLILICYSFILFYIGGLANKINQSIRMVFAL